MKVRSMKKAVAMLALAVAMGVGTGSALAARDSPERRLTGCQAFLDESERLENNRYGADYSCDDGNTYETCRYQCDYWIFSCYWICS